MFWDKRREILEKVHAQDYHRVAQTLRKGGIAIPKQQHCHSAESSLILLAEVPPPHSIHRLKEWPGL